jgi:hypothetical protein
MNCTLVKVEYLVSAYLFYFSWKIKRVQSGKKSIPYRFRPKKKLKESVCIGIAGLKQEDNIKMDLIVVNLERGFIWLRAQSSGGPLWNV